MLKCIPTVSLIVMVFFSVVVMAEIILSRVWMGGLVVGWVSGRLDSATIKLISTQSS